MAVYSKTFNLYNNIQILMNAYKGLFHFTEVK